MTMLALLWMAGVLATTEPQVATPPASGPAVEWVVEIYESPAGAPPPDVAGPQGTRLYAGTLKAPLGAEVRQFVQVGEKNSDPAKNKGISILLTSKAAGDGLETRLTVDTNLPFGPYDQKKNPVWLRSQASYTAAPGKTQFVTERTLSEHITSTVAPPDTSSGPSTAAKAADVVDTGANVAYPYVPGAGYVPSVGGLFSRNSSPKPRKTVLLFVITATQAKVP